MSRLLRAPIFSFLLLTTLVGLCAYSLAEANWVKGNSTPLLGLWLGLSCGLGVTLTRWRAREASAYSFTLSLIATVFFVGRVWPTLTLWRTQSFLQVLWFMRVQLLTFADRARGWLSGYWRGEKIQDTGLFVLLLTLLVWHASVWLVWRGMRQRQVLSGVLPFGFLLAVNVHLSGQPAMMFWGLVALTAPLLALEAFTRAHADWDARSVDYPLELGNTWASSALTMAVMIGLLAWAAPYVGTRQGWETLGDWARVARLRTANTADQLFSGVRPPAAHDAALVARVPDLARIGTPIEDSNATLMWVTINDDAPPPPQSGVSSVIVPKHYWRSGIFSAYAGTGWQPLAQPRLMASTDETLAPPRGRYQLRQHYEIVVPHSNALFAVNSPIATSAELRGALSDNSVSVAGTTSTYEVISWATQVSGDELQSAATQYPPEIESLYLQLPETVPQRVRDLAARVTANASTPYAKALSLQTYLRVTYPYLQDVPLPSTERDAVDYFLFEAPGGFCTYYASAMAVMLRAVGVPARVVTGYTMGDYDYTRGAWRIPANAAHAWVEVYFPGYDWVEFEPTPARSAFIYSAAPEAPELLVTPDATPTAPGQGNVTWGVVIALGVMVAVMLVIGWGWQARAGSRNPRERAQALYRRVRSGLAQAHLVASPSVTAREFFAQVAPVLNHTLQVALKFITQVYEIAMFSPHAPREAETRHAEMLWRETWWARLRLWVKTRRRRL